MEEKQFKKELMIYIKSLDTFIKQQQNSIEDNNWENGYLNREISLKQDKIRLNHEANALLRESIKEAELRKQVATLQLEGK